MKESTTILTKKLFGTDGIRGKANIFPMTPNAIVGIALATADYFFKSHEKFSHRLTVVIGKDTRSSGYMVESALQSGFVSMGADVILLGPIPTPAVAYLTRSLRADLGVMISASHNPYDDNGIKFFDSTGSKLNKTQETEIEELFGRHEQYAPAHHLGKAIRMDDGQSRYLEFVKSAFTKDMRLDGLKIVVDCAHGASYKIAPKVLWELGAEVIPIGVKPNGININHQCGATYMNPLQRHVLEHKADVGIALDGDADRLIIVDHQGQIIDGDFILGFLAKYFHKEGRLKGQGIVSTVMANLGLETYLNTMNLQLHRTSVGDKYVIETMKKTSCNIGGEQSGHIVLSDHLITGDGLLAALQVLGLLVKYQKRASDILKLFVKVPQFLKNVKVSPAVLKNPSVQELIKKEESRLIDGRCLIRASGTEPLVRIMLEGYDQDVMDSIAHNIEYILTNS
jgi:phosphoglucosamine mutase